MCRIIRPRDILAAKSAINHRTIRQHCRKRRDRQCSRFRNQRRAFGWDDGGSNHLLHAHVRFNIDREMLRRTFPDHERPEPTRNDLLSAQRQRVFMFSFAGWGVSHFRGGIRPGSEPHDYSRDRPVTTSYHNLPCEKPWILLHGYLWLHGSTLRSCDENTVLSRRSSRLPKIQSGPLQDFIDRSWYLLCHLVLHSVSAPDKMVPHSIDHTYPVPTPVALAPL